MTRMRWLTISFWVFVVGMLLWQFISYNNYLDRGTITRAQEQPQHFYFYNTNINATTAAPTPPPKSPVANLVQSNFSIEDHTPTTSNFTASSTVANIGGTKATDIQIWIRPYRGIQTADEEMGAAKNTYLSDDDPMALIGQWVSVPDLDPGKSATVTAVFLRQPAFYPGNNPNAQITFTPGKSTP